MADIRIERDHGLGLARARQVARQWAEEAEQRLQLRCETEEGRSEDVVHFSRPGVTGRLRVTAERFDLEASLGFLLSAFRGTITREIESHLDGVLAEVPRPARAAGKAGAKVDGGAAKAAAKTGTAAKSAPKTPAKSAAAAKKRAMR
jgi:putative polyhydroxyalkanoate system protein